MDVVALDEVADADATGPTRNDMLITIDDLAGFVGVVDGVVEIPTEIVHAIIVASEPALVHALEHDLGGDIELEGVAGVPFEAVPVGLGGAIAKLLVGASVVVPPRQLHETSAVVGLAGLGVLLAVGHALALAVF